MKSKDIQLLEEAYQFVKQPMLLNEDLFRSKDIFEPFIKFYKMTKEVADLAKEFTVVDKHYVAINDFFEEVANVFDNAKANPVMANMADMVAMFEARFFSAVYKELYRASEETSDKEFQTVKRIPDKMHKRLLQAVAQTKS